ncbi:MAG: hypothetical protein U5L04_15415 [Trueperaceae bacterium]|nr:hypothetical protein [Trueperaceae bacterium]MDZ7705861.1 hypothetical protein [Trueperaceae bacterium]
MGWLLLGLFALSIVAAAVALRRDYQAHHDLGSAAWNRYQQQLRDHLDALPADADPPRQQLYERRLRQQLRSSSFADATEKQRATVSKQHDELFRQRARYELELQLREAEREVR